MGPSESHLPHSEKGEAKHFEVLNGEWCSSKRKDRLYSHTDEQVAWKLKRAISI